jgi:(2R)-sulfolactate sulfo-lyase subunit alpha
LHSSLVTVRSKLIHIIYITWLTAPQDARKLPAERGVPRKPASMHVRPPPRNLPRTLEMIDFVVHDDGDSVGVVVVEGVKAGRKLAGWIMDQDKDIAVTALSDIPIGHKLAIRELKANDTVIKYGVDIGRTIAPIKVGEHLHVHNVKTKRW